MTSRPPLWRDVRILRAAFQLVVLAGVVGLFAYLYDNLRANQRALGIDSSFDFLDRAAGFPIAYSDLSPADTVWAALVVGLRNTIAVAVVGNALTLVLGTLVGIARLSSNWLVRKAAGVYVGALRNVPPLLVVLFVYTVLLTALPPITEADHYGGLLLVSVSEIGLVSVVADGDAGLYVLLLAVGALGGATLGWWRMRQETRTGRQARRWIWGGGLFLVTATVGHLALEGPVRLSHPEAMGGSVEGGIAMGLPYVGILVGLVLYTTSHVAEIVRGSILVVPRGQRDAASALGLSSGQQLRYVVLPQAFRIALPPMINQFLNLTKNTSLGVAIAYAEAMYVTRTVIGNGNPAIQSMLVVMGMYLALSLSISVAGNLAIRRFRLVDR